MHSVAVGGGSKCSKVVVLSKGQRPSTACLCYACRIGSTNPLFTRAPNVRLVGTAGGHVDRLVCVIMRMLMISISAAAAGEQSLLVLVGHVRDVHTIL